MSTGYLILYYKNSLIESYIRNFLMTKYISLNNAIGSNKLISKIKIYHRNYFCFINKENRTFRCIIKLNKITNHQINLKIKSQQELALTELKKAEIFKSESAMLDNFFNLDNNTELNNLNNKFNLIIKESNNVYEFKCILLEDSIEIGVFEKIKTCMKDKENSHNNEIQHNLGNNPLVSNIFNFQDAFGKKNLDNARGNSKLNNTWILEPNNEKQEQNFLDMKFNNYFLYDRLLIDKNDNKENKFFNKEKIKDYIDLDNKFKPIFKISNTIFSKPFSELDDIKNEIMNTQEDKAYNWIKMMDLNKSNDKNKDSERVISQFKKADNKGNGGYINYQNLINYNSNRYLNNNISTIKDENKINDRYKTKDSNNNFSSLYLKKETSNNSFKSYDNNNYYNNNGGYKYHNRDDMNDISNNGDDTNRYEKFDSRNSFRESNHIRNIYNSFRRNDSYGNRNNDNIKNYPSNNNYSYH